MTLTFRILIPALFALSGCATPGQAKLDAEVSRLCAIDGGIRVYEQVHRAINFRADEGESALGPDYLFKMARRWYTPENTASEFEAKMSRVQISIVRRADAKLLSEMIVYQRAAGDVPGPWHPSSFSCPDIPGGEQALIKETFVK